MSVVAADDGPVRFGLWYDFRNPAQWARPFESFYKETLDQIAWAEELGYRSVWLTEHHFVADGYTPSPLVIAGAIAARTTEMVMSTSLMLLPLHDPIRLAEDAATLSILSGGRFHLGLGIGYRQIEFDTFHRSLSHRPSLMEEGCEIIQRAWTGRSLQMDGKRFQYPDVTVYPVPEHKPMLLIGAMSEPAIDRAARIGDGFLSTQNAHQQPYLDALVRHGKDPATASIHAGQWAIIDEDPEATWARIGDHALYQLNEYIGWGAFGPPADVPRFPDRDAIVAGGGFTLWDGPTAVKEIVALLRERPQIKDIYFWAQLPGEPIESGSRRMEFFMREVAPKVRAELGAPVAAA
jgi:alkanesulfonate monooxygenase SsuD/methylene tetrahydromethanopterin reductase-like flavin-dependent oxidoreductase (luciferase family)